jgi:hypothetical protein
MTRQSAQATKDAASKVRAGARTPPPPILWAMTLLTT